jgi:hypothetical protein
MKAMQVLQIKWPSGARKIMLFPERNKKVKKKLKINQ